MEPLTREQKIKFIIESIEEFEGVTLPPEHFKDWSDEKVDRELDFYDELWLK